MGRQPLAGIIIVSHTKLMFIKSFCARGVFSLLEAQVQILYDQPKCFQREYFGGR